MNYDIREEFVKGSFPWFFLTILVALFDCLTSHYIFMTGGYETNLLMEYSSHFWFGLALFHAFVIILVYFTHYYLSYMPLLRDDPPLYLNLITYFPLILIWGYAAFHNTVVIMNHMGWLL